MKVKLNFTSDKDSQVAVQNFIHAYRGLFTGECIGPQEKPLSLYELTGNPAEHVDKAPAEEPFVAVGALSPTPSKWGRFKDWACSFIPYRLDFDSCIFCGEKCRKRIAGLTGTVCWDCALSAAAIVEQESEQDDG